MKIKLKNLGAIKQAEFEIGDLTIICGKNNTGKTYTTYALFGKEINKILLFSSLVKENISPSPLPIITVPDASVEDLLRDGSTSIDLMHYATQIDDILQTACQEYSKQLAIT
jgi:translation initiation factor RLI1